MPARESMTTSLVFHPAERGHLPAVLRLYAQPGMDDGKVLALAEAERIFVRMADYPDYTLYVAMHAGQVVGSFALLIMDNLGHLGTPSAIIEDVVVDPAWQGQGVGKAMVGHALVLARARGCYKLALSSNLKRRQAHAFYESLGFERHGYSYLIELE